MAENWGVEGDAGTGSGRGIDAGLGALFIPTRPFPLAGIRRRAGLNEPPAVAS